MHVLSMPSDQELVMALSKLAIAHTQLELVLRYTVKTLSGLSIADALDATSQDRMPALRERIKQLFKEHKATPTEKVRLDALLQRAKRLTDKRNNFLHSVWSSTPEGRALMKGADHAWGPAPTAEDVQTVTSDLLALYQELNDARLHGFIAQVANRPTQTPTGP